MDYHGHELTLEAVRSGLGLTGDARSVELARLALTGDLGGGLALIASVRDDGLDLRQFQREVVSHLRQLLLVQTGAESALSLTKEQAKEMKKLLEGVTKEALVQALRAFGQADLRGDPLSSLPLELALAECALARDAEPARRPAPVVAPPPQRQPDIPPPAPASAAEEDVSPPPRPASRRKKKRSLSAKAKRPQSAEEPRPAAEKEETAAGVEEAEIPVGLSSADLAPIQARWQDIYQLTRKINFKAGALLNSGCAIVGLDNGTIVFGLRHEPLAEKMNSGDGGAYLQALREAVQQVLGSEYDVRCVFDDRASTPRAAAGSAGGHLVQAARELGARLVRDGENEETSMKMNRDMMRQIQQMQSKLAKAQEELEQQDRRGQRRRRRRHSHHHRQPAGAVGEDRARGGRPR